MPTALRRTPVQARARRQVEHLLAVADGLLAAEGADALTTTRLAEAAGVSVGAVYSWFGGREAVVEALALRHLDAVRAAAHAIADEEEARPSGDPARAMLEGVVAAFRTRPGFRALWFGGLRTEELRDATRPGLDDVAAAFGRALAANAPAAGPEVVALAAATAVRTADALVREAFRLDPAGDRAVLDETHLLLRTYVNHRLGGHA